jgi:hypothetical protein
VTGGLGVSGGLGVLRLGDDVGWRIVTATAAIVAVVATASWTREFRHRHWRPWVPHSPRVLLALALLAAAVILGGPRDRVDLAAILAAGLVAAAVHLHLRRARGRRFDLIPTDLRNWSTPVGAAALIAGGLALTGVGVVTVADGEELRRGAAILGGVSLLVDGVVMLCKYRMVLVPTLIGGSLALTGFGVAQILDGVVLLGVAVIGCGAAMAGLMVATYLAKDATDTNGDELASIYLAMIGCVVALTCVGAAGLATRF